MHNEVIEFCSMVREKYPEHFNNRDVVDIGSKNINGDNRYLFHKCRYLGIDLSEGPNVVIVARAHTFLYQHPKTFDVVISTEALEHDKHWQDTLRSAYAALKPNGLMIFTAGGDGRTPHGIPEFHPGVSPDTNDYYGNISNAKFDSVLSAALFKTYYINQDQRNCDFQFYGIKNN